MDFQPGLLQLRLYSQGGRLEASDFGFKKRDCSIRVAKTKALISFAVTAKLVCSFVFAYANCWFSYAAAHFYFTLGNGSQVDFKHLLQNYLTKQNQTSGGASLGRL